MRNSGVRSPGGQPPDHRLQRGRQVGHVVGLDVADGAVDVAPVAQRAVDDQQVAVGAGLDRHPALEVAPHPAERLAQRVAARRRGTG